MTKPLIDIDFLVGVPEVDAAHQRICTAASEFQRVFNEGTDLAAIIGAFRRLRDLVIGHFAIEEPVLRVIEQSEAGRAHAERHRKNHRVMQDSFTYAFDRLAATASVADLPSVISLIPQKYLGEMLSIDREMAELYARLH